MKSLLAAAALLLPSASFASTMRECLLTVVVKSLQEDAVYLGKANEKVGPSNSFAALMTVEIKTSLEPRPPIVLGCAALKGNSATLVLDAAQAANYKVGQTAKFQYSYSSPRSPVFPNFRITWTPL